MPGEFIGVFFGQGVGEVNVTVAGGEVFFVEEADALDLTAQVGDDGFGEGDDAVFLVLAVADGDGTVFQVEVFDAQAGHSMRRRPEP